MLYAHGKASAEALALLVNYWRTEDNVRNLLNMLNCFSKVIGPEGPPSIGEGHRLHEFVIPIVWLAIMIHRFCASLEDVNIVMGLIHHSKRLGYLRYKVVSELWCHGRGSRVRR